MLVAALTLSWSVGCTSSDTSGSSAKPTTTTTRKGGGAGVKVVDAGRTYRATIRRTTDGVPHITGKTLPDAAFGQGYAGGEDRTCDLADQVVKIRSERARWFGAGTDEANLSSDVKWLGIGIFARASKDWNGVPKDARRLFEAYVTGWNTHLEKVGVKRLAGWCKGDAWVRPLKAVEVYAYARSIALSASGNPVGAYIPTAAPPAASSPDGARPANLRRPTPPAVATQDRPAARPASNDGPTGTDALRALAEPPIASNGWAIGAKRSATGGGLLLANPHFPWEGELRFWEVHLTVPGSIDAYGAQLSGVPGIGIGFTKNFGWTHTVSAGNRFTAYSLDLVPGSPLTYRYGKKTRDITPTDHRIKVLGDDGKVTTVTRTTYASHYGPVINFPGYGWTAEHTITYRDANVDDDEFIDQYFGMLQAKDFDEFMAVHRKVNGIPLFNTIATSQDGRAWYADTSATPDLSTAALAKYEKALASDPVTKVAADNGAILLNGSDPTFEWVNERGARDPGLVPAAKQPRVERSDYVFNANDSFWMPHAKALLTGDYSPLHGRQRTVRSTRTRQNATILGDTSAKGASGRDGFTLDELGDAALLNEGFLAKELLKPFVKRCQGDGPVEVAVDAVPAADGVPGLPAGTVDVAEACKVLAGWDGVYDLDRAGPALWREVMVRVPTADQRGAGLLWAKPFDPTDPLHTPGGLAPAPASGADPLLQLLGRAVQSLRAAGYQPDVRLGEIQFALRNGKRIPIHGGAGVDGTTNVVNTGTGATILDPALTGHKPQKVVVGSPLTTTDGETGYLVNNGTSFLMALAFDRKGPHAKVFLTYSDTEDRTAADYTAATKRFSAKRWRRVAFTEAEVAADTRSKVTVRS